VPLCAGCSVSVGSPGPDGVQGVDGGEGVGVGVGLGVGVGVGVGEGEGPAPMFVASDDPPHPVNVTASAVEARNRKVRRLTAFRT
jgi:hypothetical protein